MTGATGHLGRLLLPRLLDTGWNITVLTRESSRMEVLVNLELQTFSSVLHLSTCYGQKGENQKEIFATNYLFPKVLVERAIKGGVAYFINCDTALPANISDYAASKNEFKKYLHSLNGQIQIINMVCQSFYGPGMDSLLDLVIQDVLNNKPDVDLTSGLQKRDFIFIEDVLKAFCIVLSNLGNFTERFNEIPIGTGKSISMKDVVLLIKEFLPETTTRFNFGARLLRPGEPEDLKANAFPLQKLGLVNFTDLGIGLQKTIRNRSIESPQE